jgi:hypothetical protein
MYRSQQAFPSITIGDDKSIAVPAIKFVKFGSMNGNNY